MYAEAAEHHSGLAELTADMRKVHDGYSFEQLRDAVFLFRPGDVIRFTAIGPADWYSLAGRLQRGEIVPQPEGRCA